jgi:hypothetical protein
MAVCKRMDLRADDHASEGSGRPAAGCVLPQGTGTEHAALLNVDSWVVTGEIQRRLSNHECTEMDG